MLQSVIEYVSINDVFLGLIKLMMNFLN